MVHKLMLFAVMLYGLAFSATDICDSASNYRLYETSKKCFFLGNNLAYASLGLISIAGLSTFASRDMPFFFLKLSPFPLLASLPFYITGGIQRSMYNFHLAKCGNFRPNDLTAASDISKKMSHGPRLSPSNRISAMDICDSASNYRLYETSKKCFYLGNNLAFASLGLIAVAGLSTFVSRDMPFFFLKLSPFPLLASLPFYITGGIQRSMYNSHLAKCGNFRPNDLTEASEMSCGSPSSLSYRISAGFDF
jgi:hypothetical protein